MVAADNDAAGEFQSGGAGRRERAAARAYVPSRSATPGQRRDMAAGYGGGVGEAGRAAAQIFSRGVMPSMRMAACITCVCVRKRRERERVSERERERE